MKNKLNVTIIYKVFNHYRKPIFDELDKHFDLTVLHSLNENWVKSAKANYSKLVRSFSYGKRSTQVWLFVENKILMNKPDVIIHEFTPSLISLYTTFLISKILNIKFIIWGHGYNRRIGFEKKTFSNKIRYFFMKYSDSILVYGQRDKKLFSKYFDSDKIFIAQNTVDTEKLITFRTKFESFGRNKIKDELNFKEGLNIITICRLIEERKIWYLIDLAKLLENKSIDFKIRIIGAGSAQREFRKQIEGYNLEKYFLLLGEIYDDEITGKYLFASDIFILPSYLGLAINHSLCFSCPVISFDDGTHGPEIEYIISNKTGKLFSPYMVDDMTNWLINSRNEVKNMRNEIPSIIEKLFSKKLMVNGIISSIEYVKGL